MSLSSTPDNNKQRIEMDSSMTNNPLSDWFGKNSCGTLRSDVEEFFSGAGEIKDRLKVMYVFMAMASAIVGFFSSMDKDFLPAAMREELEKASSSLSDTCSNLRAEFGQDMDALEAIGSDGNGLRSRCDELERALRLLEKELYPIIERNGKKALHELDLYK